MGTGQDSGQLHQISDLVLQYIWCAKINVGRWWIVWASLNQMCGVPDLQTGLWKTSEMWNWFITWMAFNFWIGVNFAKMVARRTVAVNSSFSISDNSGPVTTCSVGMPTSLHTFTATARVSPVITLTCTLFWNKSLRASFAESLGGSRNARKPWNTICISVNRSPCAPTCTGKCNTSK